MTEESRREPGRAIRRAARDLGFDQVGVAPAERPAHADWYREWLDRGWQGEMEWMGRDYAVRRRMDPSEALPGCRSLIVVSLSYATPENLTGERPTAGAAASPARGEDDGAESGLRPVVARYVDGNRDYHLLFEERLERLADRVEELAPGAETRPYVDYGPVLERDHAQRAGLGWIGKNTCLIDPERGSYLLLGELLTTLDLPPDEPFREDRCGSCRRCIEACPTDAIRGPRELDARRCISYLTIELEGSIPVHLREAVGNRVFGCDICQEVCPWNRETSEAADPGLRMGKPVEPGTMTAWAEELLDLDDREFEARYGDTPYERPGREGLLRNLCVGLGNSGSQEAARVLLRAVEEGSELVAEHAAWALGRLGARAPGAEDGGTSP
ncbi:MAG: tRNA epoxyqueuosine(34) reductase QueG [Candidatus Palauibacterales bacterium]|nr:tRNA epoxyqueuosine(34) reductase QueG [Candidatus Palauibacterales bacterium]